MKLTIFKKVLWSNLFIMLLYNIWLPVAYGHDQYIFVGLAFFIVIQVVLNFIIGIIFAFTKKDELTRAFLLSSGLVLLIGFSTCLGNTMIN